MGDNKGTIEYYVVMAGGDWFFIQPTIHAYTSLHGEGHLRNRMSGFSPSY